MEKSLLHQALEGERKKTDQSLAAERGKTDESLTEAMRKTESRTKLASVLASHVLEGEREQTDEDLQKERSKTDIEVTHASSRLSDEIAQHVQTKVELTSRDEFLAIVSHDLKNPIGAISLCADNLLAQPEDELNLETRSQICLIKRNADTALRLIADLLDMERIAHGQLQLQFKSQCFDDIIQEAIEGFAYVASARHVSLRVASQEKLGMIVCDRERIVQVLSNLINNALKFTPAGGSIIVDSVLRDSEVQVSVRDTGSGIPEEKQARIFERFTQLGSKDRKSLGLGLYISRMLVEAHRGRIWVQSKIGEGSTFTFAIPR